VQGRSICLPLAVAFALAGLLTAPLPAARSDAVLSGQVVDENGAPVGGAKVTLRTAGASGAPLLQTTTDPAGRFLARLPAAGTYLLDVQHQGFFELRDRSIALEASTALTFVLNPIREVFQTLDVDGTPSPVDLDEIHRDEQLTGTEINDVPFRSSNSLRNALQLMPSVLEDQSGALHFAGGAENQTLYTLNGFDIGDPVTGRLNTQMGLDGVQSIQFLTGRYSPEFGKGSSGVLSLKTDNGSDQFRFDTTNFVPGLDTHSGIHMGGWTPRVVVSGPIWKGHAWFADDFDFQYSIHWVDGLPKGQNSQTGWQGANVLHTQVNLSPVNIVFADFLVNQANQSRFGLGVLDPVSTTTTDRSSEYFWSLKDQIYFGHGALIELGVAQNRFELRQFPQGDALYIISPEGRSGNYFVDSSQRSRRDQILVDAFLPHFKAAGVHQIKAGVGLDRLNYKAGYQRTGYEQLGVADQLLSSTVFEGSGQFRRPNLEQSSYVLDDWRPRENVQIQAGLRQDWDELVRRAGFGPRVSASWSPSTSGRTKLSAGYAITYDASPLALFSQPLDQYSVTSRFNPDGTLAGPPAAIQFSIPYGHLKPPRSTNWSSTFDQRLPHKMYLALDYLRRTGTDGFSYLPATSPGSSIEEPITPLPVPVSNELFVLTNSRRDQYQSAQVSLRQNLGGQFEWFASYTRSRATSNAVLDIKVDQVTQVLDNYGPMPCDAPDRFLAWAYMPLPLKNWFASVLCDARTGFPYSIVDQTGLVQGAVNSQRYPFNFDLNVYLERRFTFHGRRFALRGGINNITNSGNPTAVYNVLGAPAFGQFLGREGRHVQVRIRFFGRS